jgi:hypothetical protein
MTENDKKEMMKMMKKKAKMMTDKMEDHVMIKALMKKKKH